MSLEDVSPAEIAAIDTLRTIPMKPGSFALRFVADMARWFDRERNNGRPIRLTRKQRQTIWSITWDQREAISPTEIVMKVIDVARAHGYSVGAEKARGQTRAAAPAPPETPSDDLVRLAAGVGQLHWVPASGWCGPKGRPLTRAIVSGFAAHGWVEFPGKDTYGARPTMARITDAGRNEAARIVAERNGERAAE